MPWVALCSDAALSARVVRGLVSLCMLMAPQCFKPVIAQLVEHLTVEFRSDQMVPGSIPGDRIFNCWRRGTHLCMRPRSPHMAHPLACGRGSYRAVVAFFSCAFCVAMNGAHTAIPSPHHAAPARRMFHPAA